MGGDALMEKVNSFGERVREGGAELGRKMSAGMSSVGERVRELLSLPQGSSGGGGGGGGGSAAAAAAERLVEEASSERLTEGPDWERCMYICDVVNHDPVMGVGIARAIKRRLASHPRNPTVQMLTLSLLETCAKNCEKMFSELASERVLDEMVRAVDDPLTSPAVRHKALTLIESWGEATDELRYLPVFQETYKSLRARGVQFPGRDAESLVPIFTPPRAFPSEPVLSSGYIPEPPVIAQYTPEQAKEVLDVAKNAVELLSTVLTSSPQQEVLKDELTGTLVGQCRQSQSTIQRFIERGAANEQLLFEALSVNDEIQRVLSRFEEMSAAAPITVANQSSGPALIPVGVVDDEEALAGNSESPLVRKSAPAKTSNFRGGEADVADLDELVFGLGVLGSHQPNHQDTRKKNNDNLIDL